MDTHHHPADTIPAVYVPYACGSVRLAASEVRIASEMIARVTTGQTQGQARMLALHATRLEGASNLLSVLAPTPPRLSWRERWRVVWWLVTGG